MTTWTEQSANSATYRQEVGDTLWDDGDTRWDVRGNVATTYWDRIRTTWTDQSATDTTWDDA